MKTCLSMIVRDEARNIGACLASVRPWIDSWAIVDTGSKDGTQKIILDTLGDLPGGLLEQDWSDFATARNNALELARMSGADYALIIDADQRLVSGAQPPLPEFSADLAMAQCTFNGAYHYWREFLVKLDSPATWYRKIHETIVGHRNFTKINDGLVIFCRNDGCRRRDPEWKQREIALLEQCRAEQPGDLMVTQKLADWYAVFNQPEKAGPLIEELLTCGDPGMVAATCHWLENLS
jgi:glycosyltransferase involved in cell wall biosynthesis